MTPGTDLMFNRESFLATGAEWQYVHDEDENAGVQQESAAVSPTKLFDPDISL
jgi:hypothetical protein